jgi:hypothetical protein
MSARYVLSVGTYNSLDTPSSGLPRGSTVEAGAERAGGAAERHVEK